jgi:uncharacterized glyoxalase superfamily protein PhnB
MLEARYIPDGWPALVPRIFVDEPEALVGFIQRVFGATGSFQRKRPTDADATHRLALEAGATSLEPPSDLPYGDRRAMVRDAWGRVADRDPRRPLPVRP